MPSFRSIIIILTLTFILFTTISAQDDNFNNQEEYFYDDGQIFSNEYLPDTIQIVILIHPFNKYQYLPYSLGSIEQQNYPKDRLRIHLITERILYDESIDDSDKIRKDQKTIDLEELLDERLRQNDLTIKMLKQWVKHNQHIYNEIVLSITNTKMSTVATDDVDSQYWNRKHYSLLIDYKNQELYQSFLSWADWILFFDCDVILTNPAMFSNLTRLDISDLVVIAPMLNSFGTYSNFWAGIDDTGYYVRTDDYLPILERKQLGTFPVPMVHSCVMINLRKRASRLLTFDPVEIEQLEEFRTGNKKTIPYDDIIAFAKSAALNSIKLYVNNHQVWGYIPNPLVEDTTEEITMQTLIDLELESMIEGPQFPISSILSQYVMPVETFDTLGVDQIYVVNLRRRPERKKRMLKCLNMLGIKAKFWHATDGKELTDAYLQKHGIRSLDGYTDPYHKRPITFGEIGCFLSHYRIWEEAYRQNYSKIIVLEDDVRFDRNFRQQWFKILERFESLPEKYDFLYLGRKLNDGEYDKEKVVDQLFVKPRYSYWTIGYMITREGIEKLLRANPTSRMIPVDEFLPVMYGMHINETLMEMYKNIEPLKALSLRHLIVSPTHYVGDPLYISDTEQSDKISEKNSLPEEDPAELFDSDGNKIRFNTGIIPPPTKDNDHRLLMKHLEL